MRDAIKNAKRIVVKVGSSTLCYPNGHLNLERIEHLVRQLSDLANQGKEVILVSSGATGAGLAPLGFKEIHYMHYYNYTLFQLLMKMM